MFEFWLDISPVSDFLAAVALTSRAFLCVTERREWGFTLKFMYYLTAGKCSIYICLVMVFLSLSPTNGTCVMRARPCFWWKSGNKWKTTGLGRHSIGTKYQTMFFTATFLIFISSGITAGLPNVVSKLWSTQFILARVTLLKIFQSTSPKPYQWLCFARTPLLPWLDICINLLSIPLCLWPDQG